MSKKKKKPKKVVIAKPTRKLKKKKKLIYEEMLCNHIYPEGHKRFGKSCQRKAVGKGTLCKKHGGDPIIEENMSLSKFGVNLSVKYDPETHLMGLLTCAKMGLNLTETAARFSVTLSTLDNWAERYKDFAEAMEIAKIIHQAWWINKGAKNLENTRFQTPLYKFLTGNLLGWSDKIEQRSMSQNLHGVLMVPASVTEDEWEKMYAKEQENLAKVVPQGGNLLEGPKNTK